MPLFSSLHRIKKNNSKSIRDNRLILSQRRHFKNFILLKNLSFWLPKLVVMLSSGLFGWFFAADYFDRASLQREEKGHQEVKKTNHLTLSLLQTEEQPLALIKHQLEKELVFLGKNDKDRLFLGLSYNKTKGFFGPNDPVFLKILDGKLCFDEQGPIEIKCHEMGEDKIILHVTLPSMNSSFCLEKDLDTKASSLFLDFPKAFDLLLQAKFYSSDVLNAPNSARSECRLFIKEQKQPLYLHEKTQLVFKNDSWRPKNEEGLFEACVQSLKEQEIVLILFDKLQGLSKTVVVPYAQESNLSFSLEGLVSDLKIRGQEVVVCKLGKQNCLLKKGDWLIKNQSYWKLIKSSQDLERYVNFELPGELFVFEGLEKKQNQLVFKGCVFSKLRTISYPIEIPVNFQMSLVEKKESKTFDIPKRRRSVADKQAATDELLKLKGK